MVVDASALLEFLLQTPLGIRIEARLFRGLRVGHGLETKTISIRATRDSRVEAAARTSRRTTPYTWPSEAFDAPLVTCDTPALGAAPEVVRVALTLAVVSRRSRRRRPRQPHHG